jgi:hypothetical protein
MLLPAGCQKSISAEAPRLAIDVATSCPATTDLKESLSGASLGGRVEIQTRGRLVFAQTFPDSGVRASHLYVYSHEEHELRFICFFRVATQDVVGLAAHGDGSVEIRAEGVIVATLESAR